MFSTLFSEDLTLTYSLGIRIKYSLQDSGVGHVEQVEVQSFPCTSDKCYLQINMSKIYKVVVSSSFAGYSKVVPKKAISRIRGDSIYDVMVSYFQNNSPITTGTEVNTGVKLELAGVLFPALAAWSFFYFICLELYQ